MRSFIKWVGGKHQLIGDIEPLIDTSARNHEQFIYVEPFVGGGALMFNIVKEYRNLRFAVINDLNPALMTCYRAITDTEMYPALKDTLDGMQRDYNASKCPKEHHIMMKERYNVDVKGGNCDDVESAAIFIFLNKTSFNGLYRENRKGEFNVSWNQKPTVNLYDPVELDMMHKILSEKVILMNESYEATSVAMDLARVEKCGLVYYFDPPYHEVNGSKSFTKYTKDGFGNDDHIRLRNFCDTISDAGHSFILSNSCSGDFVRNLYSDYNVTTVQARRNVNSKGDGRGKVDELLIHNIDIRCNNLF